MDAIVVSIADADSCPKCHAFLIDADKNTLGVTFFNAAGEGLWNMTAEEANNLKQTDSDCTNYRNMLDKTKTESFEFFCTVPVPKQNDYTNQKTVYVNVDKVECIDREFKALLKKLVLMLNQIKTHGNHAFFRVSVM